MENQEAGGLSLGDRRRLELARAIVSRPKLILLDEPVSGVSEVEIERLSLMLTKLRSERNLTMLIVEHNIPFVAGISDRMSVMSAGQVIAEASPDVALKLPAVRRAYFGEMVEVA